MPPRGGAFFGFAIVIVVALITWGIIALVEYAEDSNDSSDDYAGIRDDDSELQTELNNASPGDTIYIPEGIHYVSLTTAVDGTEDQPITIRNAIGASRDDCVLKGDDRSRVLEILHNYYIIEGFTIDGDDGSSDFAEQLVYVEGSRDPSDVNGVQSSVTGVQILGMSIINAGKECIRLRYFATDCLIQANDIGPCGIEDFEQGSDGSNGEGVYIGTALNQIDDKNGDDVVDVCTGIVVAHNEIDTQGSEGVDIKEGSYGNLVYSNTIRGQMDTETGGISLRGDENIVLENTIIDGEGACVRVSGHEYDDVDYGKNNEVYDNDLLGCRHSAIKVNESPQIICQNYVTSVDNPLDDDEYAVVRGDAAADFVDTVSNDCTGLSPVTLPAIYTGGDDEESSDDDEITEEEDDDDSVGYVAPIVEDDDDDLHEENDDTSTTVVIGGVNDDQGDDSGGMGGDEATTTSPSSTHDDGYSYTGSVSVIQQPEEVEDDDSSEESVDLNDDSVTTTTGTYLGCYKDSDEFPILDFLYEDEDTLTPASCIADCRVEGEDYAGLQGGSQCWCGSSDDYDQYGTDTCSFPCTGNSAETCGDRAAASVWRVD